VGGSGNYPSLTRSFTAVDLTGLSSLSWWAGIGDDDDWTRDVTFSWVLADNSGHHLTVGRTRACTSSDEETAPYWQRVTAPLPAAGSFDLAHVTGYTVSVFTSSGHFTGDDLYLDTLRAVPTSSAVVPSTRGTVYTLLGIQGSARAPLSLMVQQAPVSVPQTVTDTSWGADVWIPPAGVDHLDSLQLTGASGGAGSVSVNGQSGGGSGGGECLYISSAVPVTPGVPCAIYTGHGGAVVAASDGVDGTDTSFTAADGTVFTAHGGKGGKGGVTSGAGGAGGTGGTVPGGYSGSARNGGNGSAGVGGSTSGAGGGSAGTTGAGGNAAGTTAGTAGTGGGAAGAAGLAAAGNGTQGTIPGGGASGARSSGSAQTGGAGRNGQIVIKYTQILPAFTAFIAHRPGESAPDLLSPMVNAGDGADTPDGSIEYVVPAPVAGQNARFYGTYTVVLAASAINSPSATRNIAVTVTQYEYSGGPSTATTVGGSSGVDIIPTGNVSNKLLILGEITLPVKDLPDSNQSAYYTVKITDSNTADRFMDVLFLDTAGQTAIVGGIPGGTLDTGSGYPVYYLDEPGTDTDLGLCLASTYGRAQATSVIDSAILTGGPLTVDPGDNPLLVYSPAGQPAVTCTYMPRWMADRPQ
jgi:hypothetical protein